MHHEQQGIRLWVEPDERLASGVIESNSDLNLTVGVEPADASNRVQVRYRVNGGPVAAIAAEPVRHVGKAQYFKAQLPCATLRDGDTVEYGAVCQCAGRQVPSAVEAEQFAASFRVSSPSAPGSPTAAVGSAMRMELAPAMTSRLAPDSWSQTAPSYTKRPHATHLSLFVLEQNTGRPIARMPFFAEVGVILPPPKFECKLRDVILNVLREFYTRPQSEEFPKSNVETLVEPMCEPLSRLLAPEVIDHMVRDPAYAAPIIRAILQKITALATNHPANDMDALRKLLEEAILAYAKEQDLPLAESDNQTQRIVWAHPLGVLATDHAGYLSFDLTRLPTNVADALALALEARRRDPNTATDTSIWLYPMAREANKIDALAQGRFAHDAIVVKVELERPVLPSTVENLGILSMQNPNLTDWRLSPGSFATNPGALIGEDGCETLLPANVALQEFYFYQIIRLTDPTLSLGLPAPRADQVKLGVVHEYRIAWYSLGHSLGQIIYSLPLAPGESVNLAVIDWTRRDEATRKEDSKLNEQLVHNERRERTITETVKAAVSEHQHGSSFAAGLAGAYGGSSSSGSAGISGAIGGNSSSSDGSRELTGTTVQNLSDNITQASAAMREFQSTVVVESTQSEKESIETRTVVNYNHSHALTILYYEVLRHFRVVTELARRRPALLVKMPADLFSNANADKTVLKNRAVLQSALLDATLAGGFDAIARIARRPPPPAKNIPPDPGDRQFIHFKFEMTAGSTVSGDAQYVDILGSLFGPAGPVQLFNVANVPNPNILNPPGAFRGKGGGNTFYAGLGVSGVPWKNIDAVSIAISPHGDESVISFSHITITAIDRDGHPVTLVDQFYDKGDLFIMDGTAILLPTARPPYPPPPPARPAEDIDDDAKKASLIEHLNDQSAYYTRKILFSLNPAESARTLDAITLPDGSTVLDHIENRPVEIIGDYVAYPCSDANMGARVFQAIDHGEPPKLPPPDERLVTLPTRGVFAEAKLGHCNASEEIDNTRFWDWQQSPIPHFAPEIAPTVPVTPQPQQQNLSPTPFPSPIVNIVNPPNAPDPTGLAAAMNVLATPNIFRDMSGRAEVADLLKKLSDNSVSIAQAANQAKEIQNKYGDNLQGLGGGGGASTPPSGLGQASVPPQPTPEQKKSQQLDNENKELKQAKDFLPPPQQDQIRKKIVENKLKTKTKWFIIFTSEWLGETIQQPMLASYSGYFNFGQGVDDRLELLEYYNDEAITWTLEHENAPLTATFVASNMTPPDGTFNVKVPGMTVDGLEIAAKTYDVPVRATPTLPVSMKYTLPKITADPKAPKLNFHGVGAIQRKEIKVQAEVNASGELGGEFAKAFSAEATIEILKLAVSSTLKAATKIAIGTKVGIEGTFEILYLKGYEVKQL